MRQTTTDDEILHGATAIGAFLGLTRRQAFYALESGQLPAAKVGRRWVARRSRLMDFLEQGEAETLARGRG